MKTKKLLEKEIGDPFYHGFVLGGVGLMGPNFEKNEKNAIFRFWRRKKRKITVILLCYRGIFLENDQLVRN